MLYSYVVTLMVVPAYPSGAEIVKRSGVSLMLFGRGIAGAVIVGRGTVVVGRGVVTAVGSVVATVVGGEVNVGVGWAACCVQPDAISRRAVAQARVISNEIFILSGVQGGCYTLRYFTTLETNENVYLST
jgi:hypothetical protein